MLLDPDECCCKENCVAVISGEPRCLNHSQAFLFLMIFLMSFQCWLCMTEIVNSLCHYSLLKFCRLQFTRPSWNALCKAHYLSFRYLKISFWLDIKELRDIAIIWDLWSFTLWLWYDLDVFDLSKCKPFFIMRGLVLDKAVELGHIMSWYHDGTVSQ